MRYFAFISRHQPTVEQVALAEQQGITLYHVGDADAFSVTPQWVFSRPETPALTVDGVVVVHPAAALRLCGVLSIGVFENATRSEEGGPVQFFAKALHIYDLFGSE